jgi:hypothetical protein
LRRRRIPFILRSALIFNTGSTPTRIAENGWRQQIRRAYPTGSPQRHRSRKSRGSFSLGISRRDLTPMHRNLNSLAQNWPNSPQSLPAPAFATIVRIKSPRGAPDCSIFFPPSSGVASIEIEGRAMPAPSGRVLAFLNEALRGWKTYEIVTVPAEGIEMSFTLPSASPVEAYLLDESYALPPDGMFLKKARPP